MTRRAIFSAIALAAVVLTSGSCGKVVRESRSPMRLVIVNLRAAANTSASPTFVDYLLSDVITKGSIINDLGEVILRMSPRDIGQDPDTPLAPTANNEVTLTRYRVVFVRADGRNTPGVDVPYPFDGGVTATIPSGAARTIDFEIVRHVAKLEPPLAQLRCLSGIGCPTVINTIAEVTFYAHDQVGNQLSVTGYITVDFGDFADPA